MRGKHTQSHDEDSVWLVACKGVNRPIRRSGLPLDVFPLRWKLLGEAWTCAGGSRPALQRDTVTGEETHTIRQNQAIHPGTPSRHPRHAGRFSSSSVSVWGLLILLVGSNCRDNLRTGLVDNQNWSNTTHGDLIQRHWHSGPDRFQLLDVDKESKMIRCLDTVQRCKKSL